MHLSPIPTATPPCDQAWGKSSPRVQRLPTCGSWLRSGTPLSHGPPSMAGREPTPQRKKTETTSGGGGGGVFCHDFQALRTIHANKAELVVTASTVAVWSWSLSRLTQGGCVKPVSSASYCRIYEKKKRMCYYSQNAKPARHGPFETKNM